MVDAIPNEVLGPLLVVLAAALLYQRRHRFQDWMVALGLKEESSDG